jgi:hypothetical protein
MRPGPGRAFVVAGWTAGLLAVVAPEAGAASGGGPTVVTVAGTGAVGSSGAGGPAVHAKLAGPSGIAVDGAGDVAVADSGNCRVEMIAGRSGKHFGITMKAGDLYTVAGSGCGGKGAKGSRSLRDPAWISTEPVTS